MTVQATNPLVRYNYAGAADYTFDFRILTEDDLDIVYIDTDGVVTQLVLSTDYTVTINPASDGGTAHMTYAPTTGYIELRRSIAITQLVDWVNNNAFDMDTLEEAMDKLTMIAQQMNLSIAEGITYPHRGVWATATEYSAGDIVQYPDESSNQYVALNDHTSGTFATDLGNNNWLLYLEVDPAIEMAYKWARENEDILVDDGVHPANYSAYHWAVKAEAAYSGESHILIDTTLYVKVTPGTGEYASLLAAMTYLKTKRFPSVQVEINIEAGTFDVDSIVNIDHPDGHNLTIIGAGTANTALDCNLELTSGYNLKRLSGIFIEATSSYETTFSDARIEKVDNIKFAQLTTFIRCQIGILDQIETTNTPTLLSELIISYCDIDYVGTITHGDETVVSFYSSNIKYILSYIMNASGSGFRASDCLINQVANLTVNHAATTGVKFYRGKVHINQLTITAAINALNCYGAHVQVYSQTGSGSTSDFNITANTWQNDGSVIFDNSPP